MLYVLLYYPNKALVIVYTLSCWLILSLLLSDLVYYNCQNKKKKKVMRVGNSSMNVSKVTTSVDPKVYQFPAELPPSMDQDAESMSF